MLRLLSSVYSVNFVCKFLPLNFLSLSFLLGSSLLSRQNLVQYFLIAAGCGTRDAGSGTRDLLVFRFTLSGKFNWTPPSASGLKEIKLIIFGKAYYSNWSNWLNYLKFYFILTFFSANRFVFFSLIFISPLPPPSHLSCLHPLKIVQPFQK